MLKKKTLSDLGEFSGSFMKDMKMNWSYLQGSHSFQVDDRGGGSCSASTPLENNKQAYSVKVANTNSMQESIHASIAVRPSAFGVLVVTVLKMFTNTRKSVTSNAIRPRNKVKMNYDLFLYPGLIEPWAIQGRHTV